MDVCTAVLALLALTTLGTAFATPRNWSRNCEELTKPFIPDDGSLVFGKWVYVMGSADPIAYRKALDAMKSSWIELSPTQDSQLVALRWGDYCYNRCVYGEVNGTISGLAITFRKNLSNHKGHILLNTCADCLLWTDTFRNGDAAGRYIMQFTRTGKIDPKDVDTFKRQVECLNFPEDYHSYDGETELCKDKESTE